MPGLTLDGAHEAGGHDRIAALGEENATLRRALADQPAPERIAIPALSNLELLNLELAAGDLLDALAEARRLLVTFAPLLDRSREGSPVTGPEAADLLPATTTAEALVEELRRVHTLWSTAARVLELGRQLAAIGIELHRELTAPSEAKR